MIKFFPLFLSAILIAVMASSCGPGPTPATPPPPTATPVEASEAAPEEAAEPTPEEASEAEAEAEVEAEAEAEAEPAPTEDRPALLGRLHWLGHASFRLDGPPTIYFDPTSAGREPVQADIVLISHGHDDHYASAALKKICTPETVLVTDQTVALRIERDGVPGEVRALRPGESTTVGDVEIEAVPAYNIDKSYHPKELENLGFVVTVSGERLYFAGDTDRIPEMADIRCDVALLPIGGTYTMDAEEAAQAAADIGPKVAVPMHNRSTDPETFAELCDCEVVVLEIEF